MSYQDIPKTLSGKTSDEMENYLQHLNGKLTTSTPSIPYICSSCKTKDFEIHYLRGLVDKLMDKQSELLSDMMNPYKNSNQNFKPTYVNEKGEMVQYDQEEKSETEKTDLLKTEQDIQEHIKTSINEILGH